MVLLDEAPGKSPLAFTPPTTTTNLSLPPTEFLIHEVLSNFNISSDMHSVARINETLTRITSEREKTLDDSRTTLRALSRKMEISKQSMEATASTAGRKEHGANMLRLDREKFALAKGINELESSAHGLEGQLARLKEELEQVDGEDPMQSALVEIGRAHV